MFYYLQTSPFSFLLNECELFSSVLSSHTISSSPGAVNMLMARAQTLKAQHSDCGTRQGRVSLAAGCH